MNAHRVPPPPPRIRNRQAPDELIQRACTMLRAASYCLRQAGVPRAADSADDARKLAESCVFDDQLPTVRRMVPARRA